MPTPWEFNEILETAEALEVQFGAFRKEDGERRALYSMRRRPKLAPDEARGGQVDVLSPELMEMVKAIRSDLLMNPTEFLISPTARDDSGGIKHDDQKLADALESADTIRWNRINASRKLDRDVIWFQCVAPLAIPILEALPVDPPDLTNMGSAEGDRALREWRHDFSPWRAFCADVFTCAWRERGDVPTIFARRYRQTVADVESLYSRNKGSAEPGADLIMGKDSKWTWVPMSDDYSAGQDPTGRGQTRGGKALREVEMIWLATKERIYHCVLDDRKSGGVGFGNVRIGGKQSGQVVWSGENPFGRVPAFLVPGNDTPLRNPEDQYEPFLFAQMQVIDQLNIIETRRATASKNVAGPDTYIVPDVEMAKAYMATHNGELPSNAQWGKKGDMPHLMGEIKTRPVLVDPDMDKLEQRLETRLDRLRPSSFTHIADPQVLSATTASALLTAVEAQMRYLGPLNGAWDAQIKAMCDAMDRSVVNYYGQFSDVLQGLPFVATGDEKVRGKSLEKGTVFMLSAESLDFPYERSVRTRMLTQAAATARWAFVNTQWRLPDGTKGPASYKDLLDAGNYTDTEAQLLQLATEAILDDLDPWLREMAQSAAAMEIQLDSGITVPFPAIGQPPVETAPPAGGGGNGAAPGGGLTVNAPSFAGPPGGSAPAGPGGPGGAM